MDTEMMIKTEKMIRTTIMTDTTIVTAVFPEVQGKETGDYDTLTVTHW